MPLNKRSILDWGRTRARAMLARRGVRRGVRIRTISSGKTRLEPCEWLAPGPGEVLARTLFSAVSPGTERAQFNRLANTTVSYPRTPGYSGVGRVEEVGRSVTGLSPGDIVAGPFAHASAAILDSERCFLVPPGAAQEEAAFIGLGIIALQGTRKAGIGWGDRVAVLGRGILGLLAAAIARRAGASEVIHASGKGSAAPGAVRAEAINDLAAAGRRFEVVLDVTGGPESVADAARIVAPGGTIAVIGSPRGLSPGLPAVTADGGPFAFRGAHAQMLPGRETTPGRWTLRDEGMLFLDLLADGSLATALTPLERLDPEECWRFYRRLARGEPPVVAALFEWRDLAGDGRLRWSTFLPPEVRLQGDPDRESMLLRTTGRLKRRPEASARAGKMPPGAKAPSRMLGVAMIGCGEIALRNLEAVRASAAGHVRWAVDPNLDLAEDLARRAGGRPETDAARALADPEVDAVFICAPHHLHAPLALDAIRAGKHVVVEKPMARDAREARLMAEAARSARVVLTTCYAMRFFPQVLAARALVREGAIGGIQGARIMEHLYKEMSYWYGGATGRSRSSWRADRAKSGGGVLLMNLCHHLDTLSFVTGLDVRRVYGETARFDAPGDVEDAVAATLRLEGDAIVSIDASTSAPGEGISLFQIWGSEGQIALDPPPRFLSLRGTALGRANVWNDLPHGRDLDGRRDFFAAFAAAVLDGAPNPVPIDEALAVQEVVDAVYLSAQRREPVIIHPGTDRQAVDVASKT